jgi:Tol biopolymer transport system component/DNA-binding winged helix-turn-helix (wHTH) protein
MNSEFDPPSLDQERECILFGSFSYDPATKVLMEGGEIVQLPPKTCELLGVLIASRGNVITKAELMNSVWNGTFVEESNLTHHIAVLRKALKGGDFIETVPRKGLRFAGFRNSSEITIKEKTVTSVVEEVFVNEAPLGARSRSRASSLAFSVGVVFIIVLAGALYAGFLRSEAPGQMPGLVMTSVTNSGVHNSASISPDGRLIAYIQNYKNQKGAVYLRQTGTNIETELFSRETGTFGMTAFSPDGVYLYFYLNDYTSGESGIYRIPVIGGNATLMTSKAQNGHFSLSPDGRRASMVRYDEQNRTSELVFVELDGSATETQILSYSYDEIQLQLGGSFSPDGKTFVMPVRTRELTDNFRKDSMNLVSVDLASRSISRLGSETWENFGVTRWMPDASGIVIIAKKPRSRNQIFFVAYPSGNVSKITSDPNGYGNYGIGITADGNTLVADDWNFNAKIWTMNASGDAKTAVPRQLGTTVNTFYGLSSFPDGTLVFATRSGKDLDIWRLSADGAKLTPLTSDAAADIFPVASPDGQFVVFVSDRSGDGFNQLYRMRSDGSAIEQLTFGAASVETPDISPDGKWVLYHARTFDQTTGLWSYTIQKIPSSGGSPVQVSDNCYAPSLSPKGDRFACTVFDDYYFGKIRVYGLDGGPPLRSFDVKWSFHHQLPVRWTASGDALIYRDQEKMVGNLWKQPIDGGNPTKLTDFTSDQIFNFELSKDAKQIYVSRGTGAVDVVMFSNLKNSIAW